MSTQPIDLSSLEQTKVPTNSTEKKEGEVRMQLRWGKQQLDVVKQAAKTIGIPYQTYVKQTLYQQALRDIQSSQVSKKEEEIL